MQLNSVAFGKGSRTRASGFVDVNGGSEASNTNTSSSETSGVETSNEKTKSKEYLANASTTKETAAYAWDMTEDKNSQATTNPWLQNTGKHNSKRVNLNGKTSSKKSKKQGKTSQLDVGKRLETLATKEETKPSSEQSVEDKADADKVIKNNETEATSATKTISQQELITRAFADGDVEEEFEMEKERLISRDLPKAEKVVQGWGSWGGMVSRCLYPLL